MRRVISHTIAECAALLGHLEPGFIPKEIFGQVARLVRLPMVDLIPIRREGSSWSIGLVQRNENDTWWPGMWHLPGTYLRSTDTLKSAFSRLRKEELSLVRSGIPTFCGVSIHSSTRGAEVVLIYIIEQCIFKKSSAMKWFPVDKLPKNFIKSEMKVVKKLKEHLKKS